MKDWQNWQKLLLEGTVIVASILLAFSIEAWWGLRNDRENEEVALQALLEDLELKKSYLSENRAYNDEINSATTQLLRIDITQPPRISLAELDNLIDTTLFGNEESYWDSAPLNSFFQSGEISNQELAQKLASVQLYLNRLKTFSRKDRDFLVNHLSPYLREHSNFEQMSSGYYKLPGRDDNLEFPELEPITEFNHFELLSDIRFRNLLVDKLYSISDIRNIGYPGFEELLDDVINIIRDELGE